MSSYPIMTPYPVMADSDGSPLEAGYLYIGVANQNPETNPISVFWDAALTIPAAQPIRTTGGFPSRNGTPANVFVSSDFSMTVRDRKAGIVYTLPSSASLNTAFGIQTSLNNFITSLASSTGASQVGFIQQGNEAMLRTVQLKIQETISVSDFGAPTDGTDATSFVNKAILAAYKAKAVVISPSDETYSVEVVFEAGKDYKIVGPILLPSGVVLNGRGCRLVGSYPSAITTAYNDAAPSLIETAYYTGSAIVTNRASALATNRVVGSGIKNFAFANANCAVNAINMNENSYIEHCTYSNVSAPMRLKCCFYLRVKQHIVRNSSQAAGQAAIALIGGNHNAMSFKHVALAGPAIGMVVNGPASFGTTIESCTFEEGKGYSSTGILFGADAYCAGWNINSNYIEGVRYGISIDNGGSVYGANFLGNIFNNNEYALIAGGPNAVKMGNWRGNSCPDDGGTNRNLIEVSNNAIDMFLQIPGKQGNSTSGNPSYLTNISVGNMVEVDAPSVWTGAAAGTVAVAKAQSGAAANQNRLNAMPFEGAQAVTVANSIPFCSWAIAINQLTIDTSIAYDLSNILAFNFTGSTFDVSFDLKGFIFGTTVSWVTHTPGAATITVSNNAGNVRLTIAIASSVASANISGVIRHV
jgi:hypothetical protein